MNNIIDYDCVCRGAPGYNDVCLKNLSISVHLEAVVRILNTWVFWNIHFIAFGQGQFVVVVEGGVWIKF